MSLGFLVVLVLIGLFATWLAPKDATVQVLSDRLQGSSGEHWLGTDSLGRDRLSRVIVGTRVTLLAVDQALLVAVGLGVPAGLTCGLLGGRIDSFFSRVNDGLLALPPLLLALAMIGILGAGLTKAMLALGAVLSPRFFRVARGAANSIKGELFIEAARADGCTTARMLWRHLLPNAAGPLLVQISFTVGLIITAEASLSFLGLGVQPPQISWGGMIRDAYAQVRFEPFGVVPPSVMVVVTILAAFLLGDALRDAVAGSAIKGGRA